LGDLDPHQIEMISDMAKLVELHYRANHPEFQWIVTVVTGKAKQVY
jgi:hypothetical protein